MSEQSERDGIWMPYGDFMVLLARAGGSNKEFGKALRKYGKKFEHLLRLEAVEEEEALAVLRQVYTDTVILDWKVKDNEEWVRGIHDPSDESNILPFSRENVLRVLTEMPELFDDIQEQSKTTGWYTQKAREEAGKNS
jgi:hypothetical protein